VRKEYVISEVKRRGGKKPGETPGGICSEERTIKENSPEILTH